ncbi:MAG: hypothetical protein RJA92_367 [Bacteroidota bacterium]|jgi:hypothetical protein
MDKYNIINFLIIIKINKNRILGGNFELIKHK